MAGMTVEERADYLIRCASDVRIGLPGQHPTGRVGVLAIDIRRIADHGVPPSWTLPFETDRLRALVQEFAQREVD